MIVKFFGGPWNGELMAVEDHLNYVYTAFLPVRNDDKRINYLYRINKKDDQPYKAVLIDSYTWQRS